MKSNIANILKRLTVPYGAGANDPRITVGEDVPTELQAYYNALDGQRVVAAVIWFLTADTYWYEAVIHTNGDPGVEFSTISRGGCFQGVVNEYQQTAWDSGQEPVIRQGVYNTTRYEMMNGSIEFDRDAILKVWGSRILGKYKNICMQLPTGGVSSVSFVSIGGVPTRTFDKQYGYDLGLGTKLRAQMTMGGFCNSTNHGAEFGARFTNLDTGAVTDLAVGRIYFSQVSHLSASGDGCVGLPAGRYTVEAIWRRYAGSSNEIGCNANDYLSLTVSEVDGFTD